MRSFKIVEDDFTFNSDKKIIMTDGSDEEAQAVERCFTTDAGEWFLNGLHGLEYSKIRGKGVTDEDIQIAVTQAAVQDKRVKEIISIDIERDNEKRTVAIVFRCIMVSGATVAVPFKF